MSMQRNERQDCSGVAAAEHGIRKAVLQKIDRGSRDMRQAVVTFGRDTLTITMMSIEKKSLIKSKREKRSENAFGEKHKELAPI